MPTDSDVAALRVALGDGDTEGWSDHWLAPFVKAADGNIANAAATFRKAKTARAGYHKVTIKDIAEFYRAPSADRAHPDGCMVLLEDMKGGVARDNLGRPVVVALGMQHGSAEEMQRQFAYVAELIEKHNEKTSTHGSCVIVEVRPRDASAPPSFRFPDRDVRTLFDMQRDVYPSHMLTC